MTCPGGASLTASATPPLRASPPVRVPDSAAVAKLVASNWCPGTELRLLSDRTAAMETARLVLHAGRRMDGDRWCADELAPWLTPQQTTPVAQVSSQFGPLATMSAEPYTDAEGITLPGRSFVAAADA